MKLTHPVVLAFGVTMLCIVPIIDPLIDPAHDVLYHLDGPASTLFYPVLICIASLWIFFTGLFMLARRPGRTRRILWTALIGMLPWVLLQTCGNLFKWTAPHRLDLAVLVAGLTAAVVILVCWRSSFQRIFDRAQEFTATVLAFFALSGLMSLSQLGWNAWQTRAANATALMHHQARSSVATVGASQPIPHPRVIWLILDELSYRQVYEHRFPGLSLPAFDRLATQSTLFTQVAPAGIMTEYAVPSLISGIPADGMQASRDVRHLSLQNPSDDRWVPFDQRQTVFQDALDRGYSTAVSGWFNPYCRILHQVLDHCFWTNRIAIQGGMSGHQTLVANVVAPFDILWGKVLHFGRTQEISHDRTPPQQHIQDYSDLFTAADTMLDDRSVDFLFLHMPVPHPGGIYNRRTGQLTTGPSTYIDNLALADAYLAHLRSKLEQHGEWDSSTILIMGDHSWRTAPIWAFDTDWTAEEQSASDGGKFDDRPAYILKLPNQQQPALIDTPYPAVRTRALLDALMNQRIQSPQDLEDWVANPSSPAADSAAQ
jgi:hypothetical protein